MSDLQDALDRITRIQNAGESLDEEPEYRAVDVIVEAARRVANPNIEAATKIIYGLRHVTTEDGWDEAVPVFTEEAIRAALGITEDE